VNFFTARAVIQPTSIAAKIVYIVKVESGRFFPVSLVLFVVQNKRINHKGHEEHKRAVDGKGILVSGGILTAHWKLY